MFMIIQGFFYLLGLPHLCYGLVALHLHTFIRPLLDLHKNNAQNGGHLQQLRLEVRRHKANDIEEWISAMKEVKGLRGPLNHGMCVQWRSYLSVCPHVSTRKWLDRFLRNCIDPVKLMRLDTKWWLHFLDSENR